MKILKPELDALREKYKGNKAKAQRETMALQNKAGASPLSGCLPGILQIPVFYSLFMFFPIAFELRQKPFLWVKDLSSYDTIVDLPFTIPFYGDHISLFPILASIAIFFYMKMRKLNNSEPLLLPLTFCILFIFKRFDFLNKMKMTFFETQSVELCPHKIQRYGVDL